MINISDHIISHKESLKTAFVQMGRLSDKLTLFVVNEQNKLVGTLTDGDIRRGLIEGKSIDQRVEDFMFTNFRFVKQNHIDVELIKEFRDKLLKLLPVLNEEGEIVKIIDLTHTQTCLPVDAVLMAGGRGERLRPLTDTMPKPMLPVGNKPIIEHNIDHLAYFGIENIFISVKYLGEQIEQHFGNGSNKGLNINYIHENKPLGTIGAVSQIDHFTSETVIS